MARLIDADAVLKSMEIVSDKCKTLDETIIAVNMISIVENAPEVDAEPVRRGMWIDNNAGNHDPRDRWVKCSLCGYSTTDRFSKEYNYCPNCGAKMEEESENG